MLNEGAADRQEIDFNYEGGDLNQANRFDVNWVTNNELGKKDLTITYEKVRVRVRLSLPEMSLPTS